MTTVIKSWDKRKDVGLQRGSSGTYYTYGPVGELTTRNSTGTDRPPGYRPGYITHRKVVKVKPYYWHGLLLQPAREYVRTFYTLDPNYSGWETPHTYKATYVYSNGKTGCGAKQTSTGLWRNLQKPNTWAERVPLVPVYDTAAALRLLGKLREAVAGSNFNAGVALGESKRSLQMITETSTKLYKAYKAVKSGNPVRAARVLFGDVKLSTVPKVARPPHIAANVKMVRVRPKAKPGKVFDLTLDAKSGAANNWLALQYGWKPLLQDIYGGMVFIDHALRRPTVYRVSVRNYGPGGKVGYVYDISDLSFPNFKLQFRNLNRSQIVAYLSEVDVVRLSGLQDPASVAWELLPFSFVADWFIPIGNYLSARELAASLKGTFVTTDTEVTNKTLKRGGGTDFAVQEANLNDKDWVIKVFIQDRRVSNSLSIPAVSAKPLAKVGSWAKAITSIALFTQQVIRRK